MNRLIALPLELRLALLLLAGSLLGYLAARAWLAMRDSPRPQGAKFWVPTVLVVLLYGTGLPTLYWWQVDQQRLKPPNPVVFLPNAQAVEVRLPDIPVNVVHAQFAVHAAFIWLMLLASVIDIDEQIIPDAITIPGTLLGLLLAAVYPWAMLPVGETFPFAGRIVGDIGFLKLTSPGPWPPTMTGFPNVGPILLAIGCWSLWCFGLMERTWYSRRGWRRAFGLMLARLVRAASTRVILLMWIAGGLAIAGVWYAAPETPWTGLLTALVGMAAGGLLIWLVRIIAGPVLGREAMGFGDVTLMAMIGAFLGWQSCLVVFFLAPMVGLVAGVVVLILGRGNVIPYGPFLCLGALATILFWPPIWAYLDNVLTTLGIIVPLLVLIALAAMIPLLFLVRAVKDLFRWMAGAKD